MLAQKRLLKEMKALNTNPPQFIRAKPLETNILEFHFVIQGPPDSVYAGGWYHGVLKFPSEYPLKPPAVLMLTPSGRFEVNKKICMSMSDFHPESWNPMWSVATILVGLLSFMYNAADPVFVALFPDLVEQYKAGVLSVPGAGPAPASSTPAAAGGAGAPIPPEAANVPPPAAKAAGETIFTARNIVVALVILYFVVQQLLQSSTTK